MKEETTELKDYLSRAATPHSVADTTFPHHHDVVIFVTAPVDSTDRGTAPDAQVPALQKFATRYQSASV